jgi:lipid II isoglutaminyl synthase (glutamine-hydrolysing)
MNSLLVLLGKSIIILSKALGLGSGSTWPGHIALKVNKNFNREILGKTKATKIVIAGTNGKTTTGKLISTALEQKGLTTAHNLAGANLSNGLASELIQSSNYFGEINKDYLIFESDEFALPQIIESVKPDYLICLNLFRDQLDRYGELDSIAKRWKKSIESLEKNTTLILNADDPLIAFLGDKRKSSIYFGLDQNVTLKNLKHGADSIYCPECSNKLSYEKIFFSHIGIWECKDCHLKRPEIKYSSSSFYPLEGIYNKYNTLSAYTLLTEIGLKDKEIITGFKNFSPAFGRQEKLTYKNKEVFIFLSKNPTSFNESLATIKDLGGKNLLFVLNDRIPDGLDVSWIWDIGIERIIDKTFNVGISGDRCFDMGLRIKYAGIFSHVEKDLKKSIESMIDNLEVGEKLYILPNYSAMLEVRKILLGRKLL